MNRSNLAYRYVASLFGLFLLSSAVGGCLGDPLLSGGEPGEMSRAQVSVDPPRDSPRVRPPGTEFTFVGSSVERLPKGMTDWERAIARLSREGGPGGSHRADQYDTYRTTNIDRFFITKAPVTKGFRTPAEYEPSQAYMLSWNPGSLYSGANWKALFTDIIKGAWGVVPVLLVHRDAAHKTTLTTELQALGYTAADIAKNVIFWKHRTDAIWARDFGPLSIVEGSGGANAKLSFVDYRYYHTRVRDDETPTVLATSWGINTFRPDLDSEGGNFMNTTDGLCALSKGVLWYNLGLSQSAIEQIFTAYQGCKKVLMVDAMSGAIPHIDMYAKFSADDTVLVGQYTATQHAANRKILEGVATLMAATKNPSGKTLKVIRIPMGDVGLSGKYKVWRTYTNSLSLSNGTNKVVLIPTYSDETSNEKDALAAYAKAYPGWTLIKVDSKVVIPDEGAIHCITMQIPVGKRAKMEAAPKDLCGAAKTACAVASCGAITDNGCCDGTLLKYCQGGKLSAEDCAGNPSCGWDSANKWYDCGTLGTADPSGKLAKTCPGISKPDASVPPDLAPPDLGPSPDLGTDGAAGKLEAGTADAGTTGSDPDNGCSLAGHGGDRLPLALFLIFLALGRQRARRSKENR